MHLLCWRKFVLGYLNGSNEYSVELNSETDWITQYTKDEVTWLKAIADLETIQTALVVASEKLTDDMLNEFVPGKKFRWYLLLHGLVHHGIYHSVQIALLKQ